MATGSTGAPWNIPYPVGSDTYALTGDLMALASVAGRGISTVRDDQLRDMGLIESSLAGKANVSALNSLASDVDASVASVRADTVDSLAGIESAYDVYTASTTDNPVLSREAWLASLKGATGATGPEGPAGGTAVTDPAIAALVNDSESATGSAVEKRYRRSISVLEYGATGDGVTNDSAAIQATIDAVAAQGGGEVFFPPGKYSIGNVLAPAAGVSLRGANSASSVLMIPVGNSTSNPILFRTSGSDAWIEDLTISHLGFEGRWEEFPSEVSANGLVTLKYVRRLTVDHCHFKNSRGFTLNVNACDQVTVTYNTFENGTCA